MEYVHTSQLDISHKHGLNLDCIYIYISFIFPIHALLIGLMHLWVYVKIIKLIIDVYFCDLSWDAEYIEYIEYMSSTTLKCFQDGPFPQETCSKLHPAENWNSKPSCGPLTWRAPSYWGISISSMPKNAAKLIKGVIKSSKIASSPMGHIGIS